MQTGTKNNLKRIVDASMTVLLLCLMAYQVTGEVLHEWIGMGMTALVIFHQILNRRWYGSIFKGKYHALRVLMTAVNLLLIASFILTAFCGMSMSGYAVPFLYGMAPVSFVRRMHLSMSHWSFVLMGLHLGIHIPAMTASFKWKNRTRLCLACGFAVVAGAGLSLFLKNHMPDYLFFSVPFGFLDYEKAGILVFLENLMMLLFWAFIGMEVSALCKEAGKMDKGKKNPLFPVCCMMAAVIIGLVMWAAIPGNRSDNSFGTGGWDTTQESAEAVNDEMTAQEINNEIATQEINNEIATQAEQDRKESSGIAAYDVNDTFVRIDGGAFLMGSPESENWRIDDETQHEVTVSAFYIDPYETTQEEYERLMGVNPSTFTGEKLPVENISWLDAVQFANKKSEAAGLSPAYTITNGNVSWDRSANGYRLPTEAEWEYACRAGTTTPFNTEKSLSAGEANFYGHYPYEIEENYFNNSVLEARPGEYRRTTLGVGSFEPNAWGLYDCHGNVNEWCWDYYGAYDVSDTNDPTGAETGTRHVYRGGGWNDFAKNMRSAYRGAGQEDMTSYNLGVRLVRNAADSSSGVVTAAESLPQTEREGKVLIAYFSWGGNTRGIAGEIQRQTGADIFEISPVKAYSSDYNTVLMEAQEDQHGKARPELNGHVENMEDYDVILLGYPNWWASIPMPIASFLEEYDFSDKTIIPFCSHGGGRFGQSLTAIAKLAPDADMGEGLSVHYSGGLSLPDDVTAWLKANGISTE